MIRHAACAFLVVLAAASTAACGPGNPGGPSINNRMGPVAEPIADDAPALQSNDVLARDARTNRAQVKHILIGWRDEAHPDQDPRAAGRSRAEADALAARLLGRVRAGEPIEPMMIEFSEDPGSNGNGDAYEATPDAGLVFPFKRLALRLDVGEAGMVLSEFGWHVMKRVE